jgi:hypothetical protein
MPIDDDFYDVYESNSIEVFYRSEKNLADGN